MKTKIEQFYKDINTPPYIIKMKLKKLENNPDIRDEFEKWITNREYETDNPVIVEGYSAKSLAEISKFLDGEGAFMMLIELRNNPDVAKKRLAAGFNIK